ncbi:hypothetical protein GC207_08410 [bacterium]|nr:hypothetical protein [bacterium]
MIFYPGDEIRISPDTELVDLSFIGGGTAKYTYEAGFYTDFTFQNTMTGAYLGINAWSARFPNFDYVISAMDPDGDGVFPMRQANGDIVFQEVVGSPSYVHLITYDPGNGVQKILGVEFPQDTKRVTLLNGMDGGFLIDETVDVISRFGLFDRSGKLVTEFATQNYRFMNGPNIGAFADGRTIISGVAQMADGSGQPMGLVAKIDRPQTGPVTLGTSLFSEIVVDTMTISPEFVREPTKKYGLLPFIILIGGLPRSSVPSAAQITEKDPRYAGPAIKTASGLVVACIDDQLITARELDFPELSENDSYRKLRVAAGRGNEIVIPARMDDPSGGASFLVLIRLDLDTGNVEETVRFKLDEELTMTAIEFRSGRLFASIRGLAQNYLLKCDPLNLTDLEIKQVVNISSRVHFNLPDDTTQPLNATWPDSGTADHFVAAFDDNLNDTLCLDFEPVVPTTLEAFTTTVTDQGAITGTPTTVFVEQTDPKWADLLQPNTRPLTISQGNLIVTQTCEALRLTGEPDGTGKLRVRFPTEVGYTYALAVSTDPAGFAQPTSVESIPGTGSEVIRLFDQTDDKQFFLVTATLDQ